MGTPTSPDSTSLPAILIPIATLAIGLWAFSHFAEKGTADSQLTLAQVLRGSKEPGVLIVDARSDGEFARGHIPGAINISGRNFPLTDHLKEEISKSKLVIIYCDGRMCNQANLIRARLAKEGFERLKVYTNGFWEWREAGLNIQ